MDGLSDYAFTFNFLRQNDWQDKYGGFYFIHTYPEGDRALRAAEEIHSCREFFTMSYQNKIMRDLENWYARSYALIITGQQRGQAYANFELEHYIDVGVHLINAFEIHKGWALTKAYSVYSPELEKAMFVIGPRRWNLTRYSFGIWTLLLRLGRSEPFCKIKDKDKVMAMDWPAILKTVENAELKENTMVQAGAVLPKISSYFKFEKQAFTKDRKGNWNPDKIRSGLQRPEGIYKLVSGESFSPEYSSKWNQFIKEGTIDGWEKQI